MRISPDWNVNLHLDIYLVLLLYSIRISPDWNVNVDEYIFDEAIADIRISPDWNVNYKLSEIYSL